MTNPIPVSINGYNTYYVEVNDSTGKYLLIMIPSDADKNISDICGAFVQGHLINQIDYCKIDGMQFMKAYF